MSDIELIDTTLRDGNQSLWGATGITNSMVEDVLPMLAEIGHPTIELLSSTHMAMSIRIHREDPWQRLRRAAASLPETRLGLLTSGLRFISWDRTPVEVMRLALRLLMRNGIRRFWVLDPLNDMRAVTAVSEMIKEEGDAEVVAGLVYTVSPIHTDDYYSDKARELREVAAIDRFYLKDVGGLLTPERVRTLVPAIRSNMGDRKLEMHAHCNTGLAPLCYLEGARLGVDALHTACRPLANGNSQPSTENTIMNLHQEGFATGIDTDALARYSAYFRRAATVRKLPIGQPVEYDQSYYEHQVPGGMLGTLRRQLGEIGMADRLPEVLDEVSRVRRELGYPIMVTPFSQFVGAQSVLNIVSGERYAQIPNEVVQYSRGRYGTPAAPIDPEVLARIEVSPASKSMPEVTPEPTLAELRQRLGASLPDEELLLRIVMPEEQVDAMVSNRGRSARIALDSAARPIADLLEGIQRRPDVTFLSVTGKDFATTVTREPADA